MPQVASPVALQPPLALALAHLLCLTVTVVLASIFRSCLRNTKKL
jgi:hypothetical protein